MYGKASHCLSPWIRTGYLAAVVAFLASAPVFAAPLKVDFRQGANNEKNGTVQGLGNIHWINGIVQSSNSRYFENMSVVQRTILTDIPATTGNVHTLSFFHENTKGGIHAYDFLTSYQQAIDVALAAPLNFPMYDLNPCGEAIAGPLPALCNSLRAGANVVDVDVPDDPYNSKDGSTQARIDAYEAAWDNRTIRIYGDSGISSASLDICRHTVADGADTGDSDMIYILTWTSESENVLIEMAGHLAVSGDPNDDPLAWGENLGSGSISGGPYHFKLTILGGALSSGAPDCIQTEVNSLGQQDNQIKGADILIPCPECDVAGPDPVCPDSTNTYTANIDGTADNPTYSWSVTGGGSIVGSSTDASVDVQAAAACGSYEVCVTIIADNCPDPGVSCCKTVNVEDNSNPTPTCPGPVSGQCHADVPNPDTSQVSCSDNCPAGTTIEFVGDVSDGNTCPEVITRTYKCTDVCGNEGTCTQEITIDDTTLPTLIGVPDDDSGQCDSVVPDPPTVTCNDNCDGAITPGFSETSSGTCPRTITRTWTCTDACGNTATDSQDITIVDDTKPTITCPADDTIDCSEDVVFGTPNASDNCDDDPDITMTREFSTPGGCPQEHSETRCWTATDDCLNDSDECCQTISLDDSTPPTVSCPDDIEVCDGDPVNFTPPGCTDDCGDCTVTCTRDDGLELGDAYPVGDTVITCNADDGCGNGSMCTTTVTVTPNPTCDIPTPDPLPFCRTLGNMAPASVSSGTTTNTLFWTLTSATNAWMITAGQGTDTITYSTGTAFLDSTGTFGLDITDAKQCTGGCTNAWRCNDNPAGCAVAPVIDDVCEGGSATFCAIPNSGIPPFSVTWEDPSGNAISPDAGSVCSGLQVGDDTCCITIENAQLSDAGTYEATLTDSGVPSESAICTGTLIVNENPTCGVTPQTAESCGGEARTFCAAPTGGSAPYAVVWTASSGSVITPDADCSNIPPGGECCITVDVGDTYTATITDEEGCEGSCSATLTSLDCACRVTGGGVDGTVPPHSWVDGVDTNDHYTFGGQAGAPTASQPQPWGEWTHRQHRGDQGSFMFHAGTASAPEGTEIAFIQCHDPDNCNPARPAPNKQIDFGGIGSFRKIRHGSPVDAFADSRDRTLHYFEVHIEDLGEPGNQDDANVGSPTCPFTGHAGLPAGDEKCACPDFYQIWIHQTTDPLSPVMYTVLGYINGGNLQIHPPIE